MVSNGHSTARRVPKAQWSPYLSALEWAYEDAYTASPRPDIFIFRKGKKRFEFRESDDFEEQVRQYRLVDQFFSRFRSPDGSLIAGFNEYERPSDFAESLRQALRFLVVRRSEQVDKIRAATRLVIQHDFVSKARHSVFISYSHADSAWLERLRVHLAPLAREGRVECWDDTRIKPGTDWRREIGIAVGKARVAVLLLSADFLASEFIQADELPPLLMAAEQQGAVILPVIVSPCRFLKTPVLSRFQAVNDPSVPLIAMSRAESEAMLVKVTDAIEGAIS